MKREALDQLVDHAQKEANEFATRVDAIQKRLDIDLNTESKAEQALIPFLLYKEIIRLENEVDATRL